MYAAPFVAEGICSASILQHVQALWRNRLQYLKKKSIYYLPLPRQAARNSLITEKTTKRNVRYTRQSVFPLTYKSWCVNIHIYSQSLGLIRSCFFAGE